MKQPGGPAAKTPGVTMTRSITFPKTGPDGLPHKDLVGVRGFVPEKTD